MSSHPKNLPPKNRVREVVIDAENDGQRIDNFLMTQLKGVPKTHIYRLMRKGEVRLNKGRVKPMSRLKAGDVVRIPPVRQSEPNNAPVGNSRVLEQLKSRILYEDKDLLVVNKPSGLAVHGGSGLKYGLIEALRELFPHARRLELVHRLDRDTSGCLVIAKKTTVLRALHELLRGDGMEKTYVALCKGRFPAGETIVDAPLEKNVISSGERIVRVSTDGKSSKTIFNLQRHFSGASLVEAKLITGRTHQIRVHARHCNHPLAGDDKYGDDDFNKRMRSVGLKRLFLHAKSLRFKHPVSGEMLMVTAPLDDDLKQTLDRLEPA